MYFGIFMKDFLTNMLCFAIRSRQITVNWYLKYGGEKETRQVRQHRRRNVWPALRLTRQKHIHEGLRRCMDCCRVTTHTCPRCHPEYRMNRLCFLYVTEVARMKQRSRSFLAKVKMDLRVFTLLSGERAWAYIAGNNKSSLGPALDKHI